MNLSLVTMEDLAAIKGLIGLLQKSTFSLSLGDALGANGAISWLQRVAESANASYQAELSKKAETDAGGFKIKDYQPSPSAPKLGKK